MSTSIYDLLITVQFDQVDKAKSGVKDLNSELDKTGKNSKGITEVEKEASKATETLKKMAGAHAGVNRELLVLAHEASQGSWSRFGGSLLVLGERTNALGAAFQALGALGTAGGIAVGALAAAVIGLGVAFYQGAKEAKEFANAMALTNNYAGLTKSSFAELTDLLATKANVSFGKAHDILILLGKAGHATGSDMEALGEVIAKMSLLSGEKVTDVAKHFDKLTTKPAEFAFEINRSMHIFTPAQLEMIDKLEKTGNTQQATTEALRVFTAYLNGPAKQAVKDSTGWVGELGNAFGALWHSIKLGVGAEKAPFAEQLKALNEQIHDLEGKEKSPYNQGALKELYDQRTALYRKQAAEEKQVTEQNYQAFKNKRGQDALDELASFHLHSEDKLKTDLARIHKVFEEGRKYAPDSDKFSAKAEAAAVAEIKHRDTLKMPGANYQAASFNMTPETLKYQEAMARLNSEIDKYNGVQTKTNVEIFEAKVKLGEYNEKLDEHSKVRKVVREAATQEQLAQMRSNAANLDAKEIEKDRAKAQKELFDQVRRYSDEEDKHLKKIKEATDTHRIGVEVLRTFGKTQDDVKIAVLDYQVAQAEAQLATLRSIEGVTDQDKAIMELVHHIKILKAEQGLAANTKSVDDAELIRIRTFQYGWEKAFFEYKKNASDAAKTANDVFNTVTGSMASSIEQFVSTGKLSFGDFARSVIADLIKIASQKMAAGIMGNLFGDGGVLGGAGGWLSGLFANGGAFSGGVQFFADGGVVDKPTAFGTSTGIGVMGEAGPEAIVPLARNSNGQLGIKTQAASGTGQVTFNSPINITMNGDAGSINDRQALAEQVKSIVDTQFHRNLHTAMRSGGVLNPVRSY